ncbi:MAG: DUF885 family protein, partial [Flavobacteriales bacterium]|nr:DUF885 family protein [Flavobacteriales bacterium]
VLPSFILRKVIAQCDSFAELPAEDCPFIRSFETKLAKIDLSEDEKKVLQAKCTETVSGSVNTGYKRLAAYLRQLEHQSVSVAGVWQLPKGEDYYGFTLRYYCGVENDPRQLYDLGKTQLAAIEGELAILNSMNGNGEEKAIEQDADPTESMQFRCYYAGLQLYEQYARIVSESSVDPSEKATYLRTDQLSTIKLMVDIGIHQKQWLREQAVMFIKEHSNLMDLEAQQMVDEIVVKPGYYAAPKIVLMHLIELQQGRSAAEFLEELKEAGPTPLIRLQKPVSSSVEEV